MVSAVQGLLGVSIRIGGFAIRVELRLGLAGALPCQREGVVAVVLDDYRLVARPVGVRADAAPDAHAAEVEVVAAVIQTV